MIRKMWRPANRGGRPGIGPPHCWDRRPDEKGLPLVVQSLVFGNIQSTLRRAGADQTPIAFSIDIACIMLMPSSRTRSAGRYMMYRHGCRGLWPKHDDPVVFQLLDLVCDLPAILDAHQRRLRPLALSRSTRPSAILFIRWYCSRLPSKEFSDHRVIRLPTAVKAAKPQGGGNEDQHKN